MDFQFLATISALVGSSANTETKTIPAGNYSGIRLTLTGTTASAETLALDDIANVFVNHVDEGQIVRADYGFLNIWQNLKGGFPPTVSGTANTAERVVATIPFGDPRFPNTLQLNNDREASFKIEFKSAMATRFAGSSATVRVDLIKANDVSQDYFYIIDSQNQQAQGAGQIQDTITGANIVGLYLEENSNVNSVTIRQDSETVVDDTPFGVLRDQTNIQNRIESAGQQFVEVRPIGFTRESTRNRSTTLNTNFSSSGTMELYKFRMKYLSQDVAQSNESAVASRLQNR